MGDQDFWNGSSRQQFTNDGYYKQAGIADWLTGGNNTAAFDAQLKGMHGGYIAGQAQQGISGLNNQNLNFGQMNQVYGQQGQLASQLQGVASGQQAGAGELAVNRQMGQATAAQQAMARMSRGSNAALAARQAARTTGDLGVAGAGQAAQAQMQDQTNARGLLAGVLAQQGQGAQSQQQLQMQQYANQDQARNAYLAQMLGVDQATLEQMKARQGVQKDDQGHIGNLISQGAALFAMSDRDVKHDIKDAEQESRGVLAGLRAFTFEYDKPKHGLGRQYGILAQDLEKAGLGHAVVETPEGKAVHGAKLATSLAALVGSLHRRVEKIETGTR